MNLSSLQWYASRLMAMSWGERVHRVKEAYLRRTVALDTKHLVTSDNDKFVAPNITLLRTMADHNFCAMSPTKAHDAVFAYSQPWPLDEHGFPLWHELLNGNDTSTTPTFKVHYRNSEDLKDDVRLNWELNRLTWLIPSAAHAGVSGDESARDYVRQALTKFLEADRVGYGTYWSSAIELATQSLTIILIASLAEITASDPHLHTLISEALLTRYDWIERFPSRYSSANNHRLAELAALCVIAGVTPSLGANLGKHVQEFARECKLQFNQDGLNAELATDYHLYALDLMLAVLYVAPSQQNEELLAVAQLSAQATKDIVDFCGFWPRISDSDHAAVLSTLVPEEHRAKWLADFAQQLLRMELCTREGTSLSFGESGYTFLKSLSNGDELLLLADHGYLGFGDIAGHAHADSAAIWTWVNQRPLLVESGTYSYHSRDDLRDALRSSMWHNTISINGASTSTPDGPFLWLKRKRATARLNAITANSLAIDVDIPKNPQLSTPAHHQRHVSLNGAKILVKDTVTTRQDFELASHLILHESYEILDSENPNQLLFTSSEGAIVTISYDSGTCEWQLRNIETSPSYGKLESSTQITFSNKVKGSKQTLAYTIDFQTGRE